MTKLLRKLFFGFLFQRPGALALAARAVGFMQQSGLRSALHKSGAMNLLPPRLREIEAMQPVIAEPAFRDNAPVVFPANGPVKKRVAFFSGCVMDLMMGGIHRATVKVLRAHGCEVLNVPGQHCCGALLFHAGEADGGRVLARRNLEIFHGLGVDAIVNNSAGCGSTLKEYGELLHGHPRAEAFSALVKDVSEVLADLEPVRPLRPLERTVCYDAPCHLLHAQKVSAAPRKVLARIPGLRWVELPDAEFCCGAAGIYNLTQPEMSKKILARKIEAIGQTGADTVLTGNPGCLMQIRQGCKAAGLACEVLHPMELMAQAFSEES